MKTLFTVSVLALALFSWTPETYAFGQKTDKTADDKTTPDKTDEHKMGPGKMGANEMGGGSAVPGKTNKKSHKHKKSADGKMPADKMPK